MTETITVSIDLSGMAEQLADDIEAVAKAIRLKSPWLLPPHLAASVGIHFQDDDASDEPEADDDVTETADAPKPAPVRRGRKPKGKA
jgi:hypothetical protein